MYGLYGFAEKFKIQNFINLTGNCVHYMYGLSRFAKKLNIQNYVNSTGNCVHYMYGLSGFAEKLNIQNCVNLREIVYIRCTECMHLQKDRISRIV